MEARLLLKIIAITTILAWFLAGCGPAAAQPGLQDTEIAVISLPTHTATTPPEKIVSLGTPLPTATSQANPAAPVDLPVPTAKGGYLIFNGDASEFQAYLPDGSLAYTIPAVGLKYPNPFTTSAVDGAVYYLPANSEKFVRATPQGVKVLDIPANYMSRIRVSADEAYIAWSMFDPNGSSALWVAQLDENQNIFEAREIARYSAEQSEAFNLSPIEWTADGHLLFERGLTGIGGYILYGGHNSLYSYDPTNNALVTLVPAEEQYGLCLESYRPDLEKVLFNCSKEGPEIVIRDLATYTDLRLPSLPEQGAAGSAQFSPSGQRLAYAIARSNPEDESGEVVVVPADLSAPPAKIVSVAENTYPTVLGWLDEDTLLISRSQWPNGTIWSVRYDGSQLEQRATGWFIDWIR